MIFLAVVFGLGGLVFVGILISRWEPGKAENAKKTEVARRPVHPPELLAALRDFQFVDFKPHLRHKDQLQGVIQGSPCTAKYHLTTPATLHIRSLDVQIHPPLATPLSVKMLRSEPLVVGQDLEVGDELFDTCAIIKSDDEDGVQQVLTYDVRRHLIALYTLGGTIHLTQHRLVFTVPEALYKPDDLEMLFASLEGALRGLREAASFDNQSV